MTPLAWTNDLRLDQPQMDRTHEEFVEQLVRLRAALDEEDAARGLVELERLIEHTVEHFGQEDRWMLASGFSPENCHSRQHASVLQVMREVARSVHEEGRRELLGELVSGLGQWFPQHARMMDAGLVQHMAEIGYDPATGRLAGALPAAPLTHCGSGGCA